MQTKLVQGAAFIIYHGSGAVVRKPRISFTGHYKDFGYGFYCTTNKQQAIDWATRKANPKVNIYRAEIKTGLSIVQYSGPINTWIDEWIDLIAFCRTGGMHNFDIVEGPLADDDVKNAADAYVHNRITRNKFRDLCICRHLTQQIAFCTYQALECLQYLGYERYNKNGARISDRLY